MNEYGNVAQTVSLRGVVDLRINETLQTGAGGNRTYRVGLNAGWDHNLTDCATKDYLLFMSIYS